MRLYAPPIVLFLWAALAIAFAELAAFGELGALLLVIAVPVSAVESYRLYSKRRRR